MWFSNALVYHYELSEKQEFPIALQEERLKPCPPHARFIYGWLPAMGDELAQEVAGSALICLGREERILPRAVIQKFLAEKVQEIEQNQGRNVKRAEKAQMAEDLEFELLPKSFSIQKKLLAILDSKRQRLIINTASENQSAQLTALLRKSLTGISIEPLFTEERLSHRFANWLKQPETLPAGLQLASDCLLVALDNEKKKVNCKGYELPSDEIMNLLDQGMVPVEMSFVWQERIQFTLTQDLVLKRLKCLDYLQDEFNDLRQLDEEYQQQDAALTLLTGELGGLVDEILKAVTPVAQKTETA